MKLTGAISRPRWLTRAHWRPDPTPREGLHPMLGPTVLLLLFLVVLLRTAWVSDDAFITMRTVDNFVEGRGLRWNPAERVQAFTHPLWMFVLSIFYTVIRHPITVAITVSLLTSMVALWWMARRVAMTPTHAMLGLMALLVSRAFVDYSTSGLENPLTHLLLGVGIWWTLTKPPGEDRHLFWLAFIAGLAVFNRMDSGAFFAPALALYWWRSPRRLRALGLICLAFTPFILWEIFSLIYYGFPFPNTAYAKLATGVPLASRMKQGFYYFSSLLDTDPVTFAIIAAGLVLAFMQRAWSMLPWALGCMLYLVYILYIGGDFMAGRFFAGPLFISVALLMRLPILETPRVPLVGAAVILALGFATDAPTLVSDGTYGKDMRLVDHRGVADERAVYFKHASLMAMARGKQLPSNRWAKEGRNLAKRKAKAHYAGTIGYMGFLAGPEVHIMDVYALADPLLARMPPKDEKKWRIGHVIRLTPKGYKDTVRLGEPRFADEGVAEFYAAMTTITQGPVWSGERFSAIWKMNTGQYDHLLDLKAIRADGDDRTGDKPGQKKKPAKRRGKKSSASKVGPTRAAAKAQKGSRPPKAPTSP